MIIKTLPVAIALALAATASQAQQAMDHSGHAGHAAPADHSQMDPGQMDHSQMNHEPMNQGGMDHRDHSSMDHSSMAHPPVTGVGTGQEPRTPIPTISDADRAAAFPDLPPHSMHQGGSNFLFLADQLEWQDADEGSTLAWDASGWVGGDINRVWFRSEGERTNGVTEDAELQLLYGRSIGPWWDVVAGVRQDFKPESPQTWAAFGIQGMALYAFEAEATAFVGENGQTAARLEGEYDILLTNRLILQPMVEATLAARDEPAQRIGRGLNKVEAGLRLRYEFSRRFAPYIGISHERLFGDTADRADADHVRDTRWVAGVRMWF